MVTIQREIPKKERIKFKTKQVTCPQQENEVDCGIFVLFSIFLLSSDSPIVFSQTDIPRVRQFLVDAIKGSLGSLWRI